ncbi:DUF4426 domain-containing protein [Pseudomonas sp. No.21]|jgi:hypothetical protein|uniref:DUF4426 domain-containing protein n=1 Tax=Pseudomonas TaxID=286 RepID=UPI000DA91C48|nr:MULTISPECIES: DUF4426 domain-containing protein [Pseudomonas]MDW3710867.1 DUF4426 domain-containing protein [Pseudomonas sp. 2023EL-01195]PZE11746.1 DUF4426 domain-containing protein [Pseudomonas sp. 57B-090624]GJN47433.1 hypothetical protein TUM20249_34190 [Pseudomonas tohonis]
MRRLTLFLFALCLALPAVAERKQTFGDLDVHYSAFNSSFLQPDVAAAVGLIRSKTQGVVNIAVLKAGKASTAQVSGQVKDLLGKVTPLTFKQVNEGGAIYYLAQFPFSQREMLNFTLTVQQGGGAPNTFNFDQEFFPDE